MFILLSSVDPISGSMAQREEMVDNDAFYEQFTLKTLADTVKPLDFKSLLRIRETFLGENNLSCRR